MPIRILSHDQVHESLPPAACADAMEQVLAALARGELSFPLRSVMRAPGAAGLLGLMPAYRGGSDPLFALKAVCIFPENPAKHGIDAHQGGVLLYDGETGELTALVDGAALTAIRTAAVTAVATRALARPGSSRLAIIGAGSQARAHLAALAQVLPLAQVRVQSRTFAHAQALADEAGATYGFPIEAVETVADALRGADVVVTVSTAREPIIGVEQLEPGMHVNLVGSSISSTREITGAGLARTSLFVDRRESTVNESGDYLMALEEGEIDENHIRAELGEVLAGLAEGRTSADEITAFKSLGIAVEDLAAAELAVANAEAAGIGTVAPLVTPRPIPIDEIYAAREALKGTAIRTPLVRLQVDAPAEIHLKLENLQPIGSFKIRGAFNAMSVRSEDELAAGVITASAGNMAQGVAWGARLRGIPCTVVVPDYAPKTKLAAIERLGGNVIPVPFADWWQAIMTSSFPGLDGVFIHPVLDDAVMAGNGTIALELLEDLPELDAVVVPWGGGGLTCGIASALRELRPEAKVYSVEPETGAPMARSFAAGESLPVDDYRASFVDGSGSKALLPKMWELGRSLIAGGLVSSLDETAAAVRMLAERARVVAEGAGALSLAAALAGRAGTGRVVCIVSGGNIDAERLRTVLAGETPGVES